MRVTTKKSMVIAIAGASAIWATERAFARSLDDHGEDQAFVSCHHSPDRCDADGFLTMQASRGIAESLQDDAKVEAGSPSVASMGYSPDFRRYVWNVNSGDTRTVIDARTGDLLELEFEPSV